MRYTNKFLMIDHHDSFTYNLVRYFKELGEDMVVLSHDRISPEDIRSMDPVGIVLSPGPKSPLQTGPTRELVRNLAGRVPILGICLGHQTIAHVLGATIRRGDKPMHGKVTRILHDGKGVFRGIPDGFLATRYHSLVVDPRNLPAGLEITARAEDGAVMGIRNSGLLLEGVQFHPEAVLTEHGHALLNNFVGRCRK
ncbi:anthranilate synthase component II [Anaerotalea alkaliphila]|uniref:Aminodeoxychorismate/anthranilate synthase component II n=1 Tax=Anaerotalea alkaliphila TaxID=2662126 RepID=A0A7X5KMB8_9FIRM|nr:aminodeoxychorismate/anthranilate synthase component II [Anaerotalea alkaliphila]NDL66543.1 aminodeoxychorismate/anthranilate synthase component II [Anaerotalea alkaliphila]